MSIWDTIEKKAEAVVTGEKQTVGAWIGSHKGWLVTTGVGHVLGWIGAAVVKHFL